jgi:hypothetical protein
MQTSSLFRPRNLIIAAIAFLAVLGGAIAGPLLLAGPRVVSITPADGDSAYNPRQPIRITFSQPVRPESVAAAITLDPDPQLGELSATADGPNTVVLTQSGGLLYDTAYRLTIGEGVQNSFGRGLETPVTVTFATAPYATVATVSPADASAEVPLRAPLTVEFAAPVVTAEQLAAAADDPRAADALPQPLQLLPDGTDAPVTGIGRWLTPTLFGFYPAEPLDAATPYVATVRHDVSGNGAAQLKDPVSWSFTTEKPFLVGTRPFDGAEEVAADAPIEVRLHEDVDVASVANGFALIAEDGQTVTGTVEPFEGGFRFKPGGPLQRGERYEARIPPGAKTRTGKPLDNQALSWGFTTIGDLEVLEVEPLPDATEVLTLTSRISVRFNHPVVAVTDIAGQAGLPNPLSITPPLAGEGRWLDTSTFVYSPTAGLAPSTRYDVRVAAGLADQTGGTLPQEFAWRFETITPQVLDVQPAGDYVAPDAAITVAFNQPMDAASLQNALIIRPAGTDAALPGTLRVDGASATFTPDAPLDRGATYQVVVTVAARSANGQPISSASTATFRAAPLPSLAGSNPARNQQDAEPGGSVQLSFAAPMEWGSVLQNLAITPAPSEYFTSTTDTDLYLYFPLAPETDYRITVGPNATDAFGVPLGVEEVVAFRTAPIAPSLSNVGAYRSGAYFAGANVRVPFQTINVPEVSYQLFRVAPEQGAELISSYERWRDFAPDAGTLVREGRVPIAGERNQGRIDLADLGRLEPGVYFITLQGGDQFGTFQGVADRQIMAVSPYALTVKRSEGRMFVWAVDLGSGQPVSNLPIVASRYNYDTNTLDRPAQLGRTGADGVLDAPFAPDAPYATFYLWTADGGPMAFATTDWSNGINPYEFGIPADAALTPVVGNIVTDRPIYRPGQVVRIRGALRLNNDGRYSLPDPDSRARLSISDAAGNEVLTTTLQLSEFGTFNTSLPLAEAAPLGGYSISLSLDDQPEAQTYGTFSVAEYRPPAFEVSVTAAAPDLVQGDPLTLNVQARYFAGGAPANAPVRWRLLSAPRYVSSETAPDFGFEQFADAGDWYREERPFSEYGELFADGEATTDAQGRFSLTLPADRYTRAAEAIRARTLTLDVEITDVDGQIIAGQGTVRLAPAAVLVGVRPGSYVVQTGQPLSVALVTLSPQDAIAPNRAVEAQLFRREWFSAQEQGSDGRLYWTSRYTDTLVQTQPATTDAQGRAAVSFTPPEGGEYRITATVRDDQNRAASADGFVWVTGGDVFWGVDDTSRTDLIADKREYQPGETASVLVTAPYPGMTALVTIERGSVIEHRTLTIQGTTETLQVPITPEFAPNVYVSVALVKAPGDGTSPDAPRVPDLRVGLVNLPVSTAQQEVTVTVTPDKTAVGPRDVVQYTVKATDTSGAGVRAEVALALVDKAVLSLADDQNLSLRDSFYRRRPLNVFTSSPLTVLVDRVTVNLEPGAKGGGGGAGGIDAVRSEFPDTAFWEPALVTGDDGSATVSIPLPDTLTTWRLSARAITTDTRVGEATSDVVASRPLNIRPTLPRFLTAGDRATLTAVVQNTTGSALEATATVEAAGVGGQPAPLTFEVPAPQTISVGANGTAVVRWNVSVPLDAPATGAVLTMRVSGGGQQDALEVTLPVRRFSTPETTASAGQVIDQVVETVRLPAATTAAGGQVELELAPSLTAGAAAGTFALAAHPYDGAEQSAGKLLGGASLLRTLKDAGQDDPTLTALMADTGPRAIQRLYEQQNGDGGWGWWLGDESDPFMTAYAVQGLLVARQAGFSVDQAVLDRALSYLDGALDDQLRVQADAPPGWTPTSALNARAFVLFVLGEAGVPDRGRAVALFEQRANLGVDGTAYLHMALHSVGGEEARVKTLTASLMSQAILTTSEAHWEERTDDPWFLRSNLRSTALASLALLRTDPQSFLAPNAMRYLVAARDGGWRTTQEGAAAALALAEYIRASGDLDADYTFRAALDGRTLQEGPVTRENLTELVRLVVPLTDLKADGSQVTVQRQAAPGQSGNGRLYYTLRVRSFEDAGRAQALDRGLSISREYVAVQTNTLTPTGQLVNAATVGDLVQVRLHLTVPQDMRYLTVEDFLPAGLEPLDSSLKTVSVAAQDPQLEESGGELPYYWYWTRTEVRGDRVALFATDLPRGTYTYTFLARAIVPGTFQAAPATAYQTYAPEVFGRSAGSVFTVSTP